MNKRRRIIPSVLAAWIATASLAWADSPTRFDLPAQSLEKTLRAIGTQTNTNVFFDPALVAGLKAPALKAQLTANEAFAQLLKGTGLRYEFLSEKAVAIRSEKETPPSSNLSAADQMRLAGMAESARRASAGADAQAHQLVVEGQRDGKLPFSTANLDLTRTEDDVLPFQVFTEQEIRLSGSANLQDFLENRLPQNFSSTVLAESDSFGTQSMGAQVDMRGWGAMETVFLLNGRRMPAHYQRAQTDSNGSTPDLRGIPMGSIERIEILSSAAGAIYGAGVTGGVINIITRQDFHGGQVVVNYESPADTHAPQRGADFTYGLPLGAGWGLRVGAGYNESIPLSASRRTDVSVDRWRQLAAERDPARLLAFVNGNPLMTSSVRLGATPNIRAVGNAGNLFKDLPGAPASNFTTVPTGSTGNSALSDYQPGVFNLENALGSGALYTSDYKLGMVNRNTALRLGLDKRFGDDWHWSLDYRHTYDQRIGGQHQGSVMSLSSTTPTNNRPLVPEAAPTNPFGQPVQVYLSDPNLIRPELSNRPYNVNWEVSSTLRGAFGRWRGYFDLSYAHNRSRYFDNLVVEPTGGWTQAFLSGRYNPFVDPRVTAPADPAFYEDYVANRFFYLSATRTYQTGFKASGPLVRLPAGEVQLTAGVEGSRVDRYHSEYWGEYQDGLTREPRIPVGQTSSVSNTYNNTPTRRFQFDNYAAYSEATVPLLSAAQDIPLVQRLELFGSMRLDRTQRDGFRSQSSADTQAGIPPEQVRYTHTSNLKVFGFRYDPIEGLMLRASQSLGFKPPSISQVTPANPPTGTTTGLNDPLRDPNGLLNNVTLTPSMYITGGNPDLRPETTDSVNVGLVLQPRQVAGLRVSLDFVKSRRNDAIFSLGAQEAIDLELEFPHLVTRGAPDGHASGVGPITFVDRRNINLNSITSESLDISMEQAFDAVAGGRLFINIAASHNLSFKVQSTHSSPAVEQVRNVGGTFSRQIAWNGNGQVRWEGNHWGVGWNARYFDYLLVAQTYHLLQGGDRAPWKINHDVNVSYRAPSLSDPRGAQWLLSGTTLNFGVKNVFDRKPRFWAQSTDNGVAPYDSLTGRSVWMQLSRSFE